MTDTRQKETRALAGDAGKTDGPTLPRPRPRSRAIVPKVDALPPHSDAAEAALLGCVLQDNVVLPEILTLPPEAFFDLRNRAVFKTVLAMRSEGVAVDVVTLCERLSGSGKMDECGGWPYVASLPEKCACALSWPTYLEIVQELFARRRAVQLAADLADGARDSAAPLGTLLATGRDALAYLSDRRNGKGKLVARRFNHAQPPERPAPRFFVADTPVSTAGNLTAISAAVKSGKSSFIGAMIAAATAPAGLWRRLSICERRAKPGGPRPGAPRQRAKRLRPSRPCCHRAPPGSPGHAAALAFQLLPNRHGRR